MIKVSPETKVLLLFAGVILLAIFYIYFFRM